MKIKRTAKIFAAFGLLLAFASGCDRFKGAQMPRTGCWYDVTADGDRAFVRIDDIDGHTATGYWYACDEGPDAPSHHFSAEMGRTRLTLRSEGEVSHLSAKDVKWEQYSEPEFAPERTELYREPFCEVEEIPNVVYGNAEGYWTSLPGVEADVSKLFTSGYIKSFKRRDLNLRMDIYKPVGVSGAKPFILFIHGGAFYVGDKREPAYIDFCRHFASMGYVCASIDYRMGFHVSKGAIERAGYMAVQDAHAAMRYIVTHASEYEVDPSQLYAAGSSAGSITALNLAFMEDRDRPGSSRGRDGLLGRAEMGDIDASGNDIKAHFHIKAVANMWGAVNSLDILKNSRTDIVSFHGEEDKTVPYDRGYPFSSAGKVVASTLSDEMYGSVSIDKEAARLGLRTKMYSFPGEGHALNTSGKEKRPNANHTKIRSAITDFFFEEMVPSEAVIVSEGHGWYHLEGADVSGVQWKVEGGFILSSRRDRVKVLWRSDELHHSLSATGQYTGGIGFVTSL